MPSHRTYLFTGMKGDAPVTMEKVTRGVTGRSGLGKPHIEFKQQSGRYRGRRGAPLTGADLTVVEEWEDDILGQLQKEKEEIEKAQADYRSTHPQKTVDVVSQKDTEQNQKWKEETINTVNSTRESLNDFIPDSERYTRNTNDSSITSSNILPIVGIVVVGGVIFYVLTRD